MQPKSIKLLWDAKKAALRAQDFLGSKTLDDYEQDALTVAAVERQFQIIGEALYQLRNYDEETAALVDDVNRIIAFRHMLVHAYDKVDDTIVWDAVTTKVPKLLIVIDNALNGADDPSPS